MPPGVVTVTVTVPAAWAGVFAVIFDVESTETVVPGWPAPNATVVAPGTNPVPVRITVVAPATLPALGAMLERVGAAT